MPPYTLRILANFSPIANIIQISRLFHTSHNRLYESITTTEPPFPYPIHQSHLPPVLPLLPRPTREVREIQIPVPWGHIAGKWWGKPDTQPVLLLHGWQDNAGTFDKLVPLLSNESLFAIDMVGHGLSSHYLLGQCCHYIDALINLRRVIKHFRWEKVSFIGHSIGSSLAFAYAACYPEAVDKFVSIEGARAVVAVDRGQITRDLRNVIESNLALEKKWNKSSPKYKYDEVIDLYLKGIHYCTDKDSITPILGRGLKQCEDGYTFCFARDPRVKVVSWASFSVDLVMATAAQISCDVLNIRANKGYTVGENKQRIYRRTLDILEHSAKMVTYHEVEGTHYVHLNRPDVIAPLINTFFEKKIAEVTIY